MSEDIYVKTLEIHTDDHKEGNREGANDVSDFVDDEQLQTMAIMVVTCVGRYKYISVHNYADAHNCARTHMCYIYIYHELLKKTNHTTIIVNHDTDDGDGDDGQQRRQSHSREHVSLTALGLHSFGLGMILSRRGTPWPMHELPTRTGPTRKIWSRLEGTRFNLWKLYPGKSFISVEEVSSTLAYLLLVPRHS